MMGIQDSIAKVNLGFILVQPSSVAVEQVFSVLKGILHTIKVVLNKCNV